MMGGKEAGGEREREKGTVAWWSTKEGRGLLLGAPGESEGRAGPAQGRKRLIHTCRQTLQGG